MDLNDILNGGSQYVRENRPQHPDMDRIMEIQLQMKATTPSPAVVGKVAYEKAWRERIEESIDYDSLGYQALHVGFQIFGITTAGDLQRLRNDQRKNSAFIACVQAFYDGFLLGVQFEKRGGHRIKADRQDDIKTRDDVLTFIEYMKQVSHSWEVEEPHGVLESDPITGSVQMHGPYENRDAALKAMQELMTAGLKAHDEPRPRFQLGLMFAPDA